MNDQIVIKGNLKILRKSLKFFRRKFFKPSNYFASSTFIVIDETQHQNISVIKKNIYSARRKGAVFQLCGR